MGVVNLHGAKRALDRRACASAWPWPLWSPRWRTTSTNAGRWSTTTTRRPRQSSVCSWPRNRPRPAVAARPVRLMMFGLFGAKFRRYADAAYALERRASGGACGSAPTASSCCEPRRGTENWPGQRDGADAAEDPMFEALVGRPRPKLGAVLFVDQYPSRLLEADLAQLQGEPARRAHSPPARAGRLAAGTGALVGPSATARVMAEFQGPAPRGRVPRLELQQERGCSRGRECSTCTSARPRPVCRRAAKCLSPRLTELRKRGRTARDLGIFIFASRTLATPAIDEAMPQAPPTSPQKVLSMAGLAMAGCAAARASPNPAAEFGSSSSGTPTSAAPATPSVSRGCCPTSSASGLTSSSMAATW